MNKVDFTLNNGRVQRMHPKIAELLERKGKGTYRTTAVLESPEHVDMRALTPGEDQALRNAAVTSGRKVDDGFMSDHSPDVQQAPTADVELVKDPEPTQDEPAAQDEPAVPPTPVADAPIDLASLTPEQLRALAKERGVDVHHRAGAKTVIAAIEKKAAE